MDYSNNQTMDVLEENVIRELIDKFTSCPTMHMLNKDSYASPAYMNSGKLVPIAQLPMSSSKGEQKRPTSVDQLTTAWDDTAKNFIFDVTCIDKSQKYEVIILLYEFGYKLPNTTAQCTATKNGVKCVITVECTPIDEASTEFFITVRQFDKVVSKFCIPYTLLITTVIDWYLDNKTLVICHDSLIPVYRQAIEMMSDATWSVQCNIADFVVGKDPNTKCSYYMNVYGYPRSTESRAVGSGQVAFVPKVVEPDYVSKASFYNKCIRGSRHSSGKCYDCYVLYTAICSIDTSYKNTRTTADCVSFSPTFLKSVKEEAVF